MLFILLILISSLIIVLIVVVFMMRFELKKYNLETHNHTPYDLSLMNKNNKELHKLERTALLLLISMTIILICGLSVI